MVSPRLDKDIERDPDRFISDFEARVTGIENFEKFKVEYKKFMRSDPHGINVVDDLTDSHLRDLFKEYSAGIKAMPPTKPLKPVEVKLLKEEIEVFPRGQPVKNVKVSKSKKQKAYFRSSFPWSEGEENFLKKALNVRSTKLITARLNKKFGTRRTVSSVQSKKSRLKKGV